MLDPVYKPSHYPKKDDVWDEEDMNAANSKRSDQNVLDVIHESRAIRLAAAAVEVARLDAEASIARQLRRRAARKRRALERQRKNTIGVVNKTDSCEARNSTGKNPKPTNQKQEKSFIRKSADGSKVQAHSSSEKPVKTKLVRVGDEKYSEIPKRRIKIVQHSEAKPISESFLDEKVVEMKKNVAKEKGCRLTRSKSATLPFLFE
ncbi:MAG: hypothetical protein AAGE99_06200 [Chlamydiota bacterium]